VSTFQPRLEILPDAQLRLWAELRQVPQDFVLYGGTALALRLAHRASADFDFFSATPFHPEALQQILPFALNAEVLQKSEHTLTIRTASEPGVLLSFFGGLSLGQLDLPDRCHDNGLSVAGLRDLMATKLNTVYQRAEAKDYLDLDALMRSGLSLALGLACARAVYRAAFNPMLPLKALTYFEDGDLPSLPAEVKQRLIQAVDSVGALPTVTPSSDHIEPPRA
jgi:hypothetical protein